MSTEDDVMTTYCVPVDQVDPSIEETANLEIPLTGKYSTNKAVNQLMQTVLNFVSFLMVIIISTVTVPFFYDYLILEIIKYYVDKTDPITTATSSDQKSDIAQKKMNKLYGTEVWLMVSIFIIVILTLVDGLLNSNFSSTLVSSMLFIFSLISFGRVQLMKIEKNEFIKKFTGEEMGKEMPPDTKTYDKPSFSKQEGIFDLIKDMFSSWWGEKYPFIIFILTYPVVIAMLKLYFKLPDMTMSIFSITFIIIEIYVINFLIYIKDIMFTKKNII